MNRNFHRGNLFASSYWICLLVSICASVTNAQDVSLERGKGHDPVVRTFDAARNETTVSVIPDFTRVIAGQLLAGSPGVQPSPTHQSIEFTLRAIAYSYAGNVPARPQTVNFIFASDGRKPKYSDTPEFRLDADGSTVSQGKIDYSLRDSDGGKIEVLRVPVATDLLLNIARANKIQFSFGTKTYKLSDTQRKDLRALAETIP